MKASGGEQLGAAGKSSDAGLPVATVPIGLRTAAIILRSAFICALMLLTLRVSMPQSETIWQIYDAPADVVRLALGVAVCVWLAIQLFRLPRDAAGYRTWLFLGLLAVPFAVICLIAVW